MRKVLVVLALSWLAGFGFAGAAGAAGLAPPVADCYLHTKLTGSYTVAQLRHGLATMPADVREYSDCYNILSRALLLKIGQLSGGDGAGGGSFLPVWLIAVLGVLVVGGAGFGAVALRDRRRRTDREP